MFSLLHQYLINCSSLVLPGIGTLQFASASAQVMPNEHISSPRKTLVLVDNDVDENDPKLISFLCKQLDMSENQVQTLFNHFLQTLTTTISDQRMVLWENLGTFKKDNTGTIGFVQDEELESYLPPVEASWISTHDVSKYDVLIGESETNNIAIHEELAQDQNKKSFWWIWAIIIAAIAATIIAIKFSGY